MVLVNVVTGRERDRVGDGRVVLGYDQHETVPNFFIRSRMCATMKLMPTVAITCLFPLDSVLVMIF